MLLKQALESAMILNAGRQNVVGALCTLESELENGHNIDSSLKFLEKCKNRPGISNVLSCLYAIN